MTTKGGDGAIAAATVNWVTQTSFSPPLVVVGEVVGANVAKEPEGRADAAILEMKELGDNVFYGG